ncbi:restriction endonuclease subunit S (plasmid) [Lactococcus lactis subsp. lactis]|uniref:restriction endonuclease subunit S n=1 Tax=Lactococcus lactis TaxID=1358 RepID=UPI002649F088|nr:restriction endonuclease subunit S [Lactococcus lactis]WKB49957.1 restriction endonuclease subunit S [Lactococcus lactis subsp. lactis]
MSKKSPQLRFEGFTDDWEEHKLGDTETHFTDGNYGESYPSAKDMSDKANGIPFLRGSDFSNGYLDSSNANYIKPEKHAELTSGHIKQDDIVLAVRGSLGTLGYATKENEGWNINSQLAILRTNKSEISGMFLIQYLLGSKGQKEIFSRNTGTALKQLPIKQLKDIPVPVPTLLEQQKIGSFFKQLDNTIALHQRKIDLLKEQKKGYLQKMFPKNGAKVPELRFAGFADDWEERKLGEITTSYSGGTPSAGNSSYYKGDIPFIRSGEINSSKTELFLTEEGFNNSSAKLVEVGDILYALYGATSGEVGISQINGAINQAILAIKPIEGYESQFIMQWLKLQKQKIIDKYLQGGQGNLSGTIVKDLFLRIPDSKEQKKIGQFFKQLDDTIALHQRKLDLLKEQKKGFLQKMFV